MTYMSEVWECTGKEKLPNTLNPIQTKCLFNRFRSVLVFDKLTDLCPHENWHLKKLVHCLFFGQYNGTNIPKFNSHSNLQPLQPFHILKDCFFFFQSLLLGL